ncbi:TRAP transporter large permease subunit, partial [Acinetobacter towneri]
YFLAKKNNWENPQEDEEQRPSIRKSFIEALPALFAPVLILGGLRSGLFTPTEAAVVAVTYGLLIGSLVYRQLTWSGLVDMLVEATKISGIVLLIISLAGIFAWAGTTLGTFTSLAEAMLSISDNPITLLLLVMLLVLLAGMLLDAVSIYLILTPVLVPLIQHFGWNPVWFGILLAMNIAIGQFTPPVAVNLMVTTKVADIRLEHTFGWAM